MKTMNTLEDVAFAFVLNRGNLRFDSERQTYVDFYTDKEVTETDWILPASYAVAAILADTLFQKYHRCDFQGLSLLDIMDRCGVRNATKYYKRLTAAVNQYRLLDDRTEGLYTKKYSPVMTRHLFANFKK
jgi:hypothetical protein